ncbi:MAG: FKBP-type peptidyl-prolyl cis-trans isomerase, partial [Bacteroidota bacterium]
MIEQEQKERRAYEKHVKDQFLRDKKQIHEYAADNKLRTKRTPSGLSYSIIKKGKGPTAQTGDELLVHYEGFLLNGEKFDSSYEKKQPYRFVLGKGKVIKGWDEGLQYFSKGGEGWLLIPSKFAYGRMAIEEEGIAIPADSVLIFKFKVVDINSKK